MNFCCLRLRAAVSVQFLTETDVFGAVFTAAELDVRNNSPGHLSPTEKILFTVATNENVKRP